MRGHGDTVVGETIRDTVSRAIYTERNAQLLLQALSMGKPITYLPDKEAEFMTSPKHAHPEPSHGVDRVWKMWVDEIAVHK
jgi:HCOMODA/2-hydroxy-3-carboxy-muconic semialdehyde decarboxylase